MEYRGGHGVLCDACAGQFSHSSYCANTMSRSMSPPGRCSRCGRHAASQFVNSPRMLQFSSPSSNHTASAAKSLRGSSAAAIPMHNAETLRLVERVVSLEQQLSIMRMRRTSDAGRNHSRHVAMLLWRSAAEMLLRRYYSTWRAFCSQRSTRFHPKHQRAASRQVAALQQQHDNCDVLERLGSLEADVVRSSWRGQAVSAMTGQQIPYLTPTPGSYQRKEENFALASPGVERMQLIMWDQQEVIRVLYSSLVATNARLCNLEASVGASPDVVLPDSVAHSSLTVSEATEAWGLASLSESRDVFVRNVNITSAESAPVLVLLGAPDAIFRGFATHRGCWLLLCCSAQSLDVFVEAHIGSSCKRSRLDLQCRAAVAPESSPYVLQLKCSQNAFLTTHHEGRLWVLLSWVHSEDAGAGQTDRSPVLAEPSFSQLAPHFGTNSTGAPPLPRDPDPVLRSLWSGSPNHRSLSPQSPAWMRLFTASSPQQPPLAPTASTAVTSYATHVVQSSARSAFSPAITYSSSALVQLESDEREKIRKEEMERRIVEYVRCEQSMQLEALRKISLELEAIEVAEGTVRNTIVSQWSKQLWTAALPLARERPSARGSGASLFVRLAAFVAEEESRDRAAISASSIDSLLEIVSSML